MMKSQDLPRPATCPRTATSTFDSQVPVARRGTLLRIATKLSLFVAIVFPLLGSPVLAASDMLAPVGGSGFTAVSIDADGVPSFVSVDAISARRLHARGIEVSETVVFVVPSAAVVSPAQNIPPCCPSPVYAEPSGVVVAVVDTGLDASHSWFSGPFAGHVLPGRSTLGDAANWTDTHGHGTHVAGVVRLVDPSARILPVRVFDSTGRSPDHVIAEGIVWAVENGARVVNLSLGGPAFSLALEHAVELARSRDVMVVAAAGNYGQQGSPKMYPAAFEPVVAVAAHDSFGPAAFSNRGAYVDLAAEGMFVWSSYPSNQIALKRGTSMASPFVAAAASRVRAARPDLDAVTVKSLLESTAIDLGDPGRDDVFGWGAVDVERAVAESANATTQPTTAGALSMELIPRIASMEMRIGSPVTSVEVFVGGELLLTQAGSAGPWRFELNHAADVTVLAVDLQGRRYEPFVASVSPKVVPNPKMSVVARNGKPKVDVRLSLPRLEGRTVLFAASGDDLLQFDVARAGKAPSVVYRMTLDRSRSWTVYVCLFYGTVGKVCSDTADLR